MPILLTNPLNPGDIDTTQYLEVKIVQMLWDAEQNLIRLKCQYGNTVNGAWTVGKDFHGATRQNPEFHFIQGADYITVLSSTASGEDQLIYNKVRDTLYDYLMTKGVYSGTIT